MNSPARFTASLLAIAFALTPAAAHEFWIMPDAFRVEVGAPVRLTLNHGERFDGAPVPRDDRVIDRYTLLAPSGESNAAGMSGRTVSFARCTEPGPHIAVYHATGLSNLLTADAFHAYLKEEGLAQIIEMRRELGEADQPGREIYERCAKSVISAGEADPEDQPVALPYEIVLEGVDRTNDAVLATITARVLLAGLPAKNARVVAVAQSSPGDLIEGTTDADGRVTFECAGAGAWMLTSLHMARADEDPDADWRSLWASLTFSLDPR
ncbi:MAG: hypothetical protein DHS20C14_07100 [Phycisphaeraceae bacterium]|nr:MAG: hypothetical protein DHS20C14_07100 [Phycisphaeraceae bacterium]